MPFGMERETERAIKFNWRRKTIWLAGVSSPLLNGGGRKMTSSLFSSLSTRWFFLFFFVSLSGSAGPGWRLRLSVCKRRGAQKGRKFAALMFHALLCWENRACDSLPLSHDMTPLRPHTVYNNTRIILSMESSTYVVIMVLSPGFTPNKINPRRTMDLFNYLKIESWGDGVYRWAVG